jgi:hypothetical protein
MKNLIYIAIAMLIFFSCTTNKPVSSPDKSTASNDQVRIANDSLQYEVIITDPGFGSWLASRAYPRNYHTQSYLELKNQTYVMEYNSRVLQPQRYGDLYSWRIDYDMYTNYGYEVNYLLYNYFVFFQNKYNQKLGGNVPSR